jgi:hypothetical protein
MELLGDVGHVESRFGPLETVLVSVQDRCTVCTKHTIGIEIILDASDGTPRFEGQVEARFSLFGDSANLDARRMHHLCRTSRRLRNRFGCTRWNSKVTWVIGNHVLLRLGWY